MPILVDYPATLPGPNQVTSAPKVRSRASGLPGLEGYTEPERDYYGTVSISFFFTREQAAIFKDWWDTNKGYWFNAVWPRLSQALFVYRILGAPTFTHVYDGAYRVTAKAELRGASLSVVSPLACDITWPDVALLLHCNSIGVASALVDSSRFSSQATVVSGNLTSADSKFGGACISLLNGRITAIYPVGWTGPTPHAPKTQDFCVEGWFKYPAFGDYSPVISFPYDAGSTRFAALYHSVSGSFYVTQLISPGNQPTVATFSGIPTGEWVHLAWTRSGGTARIFVNGAERVSWADTYSYSTEALDFNSSEVQFGTRLTFMDEIRVKVGDAVYTEGFTPPTAPFPDVSCGAFAALQLVQSRRGGAELTVTSSSQLSHKVLTLPGWATATFVAAWVRGVAAHSGRRYCEFQIIGAGDAASGTGRGYVVGLVPDGANSSRPTNPLSDATCAYLSNINYLGGTPGVGGGTGGSGAGLGDFVQSDVIGMAVDYAANKVWFRVGLGAWIGGGDPATGTSPSVTVATAASMLPYVSCSLRTASANFDVRFRALGDTFTGTVPEGFTIYS